MTERDGRVSEGGDRRPDEDWIREWQQWHEHIHDQAFVHAMDHDPQQATPAQRNYWETINGRLAQHVASPAERDRVRLAVARWLRTEPNPPKSWAAVRRLPRCGDYWVWAVARIEINWIMPGWVRPGFIMHLAKHRPTLVKAETYQEWITLIVPKDKGIAPEELAPVVAWQRLVPAPKRTVPPDTRGAAGSGSGGPQTGGGG